MKQLKKALADELLNARREYWKQANAGAKRKKKLELTKTVITVERKIFEETGNEFFYFDTLASIVACSELPDESYYAMLNACGFEVV